MYSNLNLCTEYCRESDFAQKNKNFPWSLGRLGQTFQTTFLKVILSEKNKLFTVLSTPKGDKNVASINV